MKPYTKVINTLNIPKDEWLKARKKGIGGSDIGTLMGFNPYSSPFMVFINKTTDHENDLSDNEAVYWGTVLEETVAREFEKRTGKKTRKLNAMLRSTETPYALADVDRMIVGERAGLECKTTNAFNADKWENDEIPASYICQCQWYMYVTGYKLWYIACLIGGQRFVWKEVARDDKLIEYMLETAKDFWENNVLAGAAPPMDGTDADTEYLKEHYSQDNGEAVRLTSDISAMVESLYELRKQEKIIKSQKRDLENRIKQYLGEAAYGISENYTVSWKTRNRVYVSRKRLVSSYPKINLRKVTGVSKSRPLIIKKED